MARWVFHRVETQMPPAEAKVEPSVEVPPLSRRPGPGRRRVVLGATAAVVLAVLLWAAVSTRRGSAAPGTGTGAAGTVTVERRDFVRSTRIHGVVAAVASYNVSAPRLRGGSGNMVITRLVEPGPVRRGDLLVEFDNQNQLREALEREVEHADLLEQIKRKTAEHAAARANDQTQLQEAENSVAAAELEMRRNEVISKIDAEKNQQNLEEARARLAQLKQTLELKQQARRAELRILEIQRDRARNAMLHARGNAEKMTIRSPMAGLAVLQTIWRDSGDRSEVQEGDQVWPGTLVLEVVNPEGMEVRARINQADFPFLRAGQAAEVRLDAYPELVFPGKVERLAAVGLTSSLSRAVRTFAAVFSIQGSDPKLLPDLSAAVDVELERRPGALVVPRDAVLVEKNQAYVFVQKGSGFEKRAVKTGPQNEHEIVVESGLEGGAVVRRQVARQTYSGPGLPAG